MADDLQTLTPVGNYVLAGSPRHSSPQNQQRMHNGGGAEIVESIGEMVEVTVVESPTHLENIHEELREESEDGSGEEDEEEDVYRYVYLNSPEENEALNYCGNAVITSRFTIYNFIPKLLFYEFSKLANAYFLLISIMQTVKPISNTGGFPASLPALSIIVLIDMFFACLEDYKRHKADHIANELPCLQYNLAKKAFEPSKWHLLHVGDIVKVSNRDPVPADLVILAASEPEPENPSGICYVETKSLDGETNLKLRQGLEATYTMLLNDESVAQLQGVVVCETPNNSIHRFNGSMTLDNGTKEVITTNAVILRGSTLRNTDYIYGLVVNTGPDTKIMMASSNSPMKWSDMEKRLNRQILYICALMVILCLTGATASMLWNHGNLSDTTTDGAWYLFDRNATAVKFPVGNFFIQVLYYFLLLNSFIPVSLYVSMTSVKFMQAYFMNNDLDMYHEESDTPCQVRTMSLNEELGQIDYIFTDKTGTLTCNIMEFRKCTINGVAYGMGDTEVGLAAKKRREEEEASCVIKEEREDEALRDSAHEHRIVKAPFVNYQDDAIFDALAHPSSVQAQMIMEFFEHLSVCHTVMPERASDGTLRLSASSPDEQALVAAAGCFGFRFVARSPGKAMVKRFSCLTDQPQPTERLVDEDVSKYDILEVLEFNSTRKRMSVIIRAPDGGIKLLCKGADTVMYERLRPSTDSQVLHVRNQTLKHMEQFASEGLRTLVIGTADIDASFFESWVIRYRTAINDMRQIELRRQGEANDIDRLMEEIEVNLEILGATAIEDRLQEGVPDTIFKLRQASIKIWMLTGDKEETAINIGFACQLLASDIERVVISADTHPDLISIEEELERYRHHLKLRSKGSTRSIARSIANDNDDYTMPLRDGSPATSSSTSEDVPARRHLTRIESLATMNSHEGLALVIDGETLELALAECPDLFLSVAENCVAVIACRVSPAQKSELVQLVRDNNPDVRTLAIGDGANDVSMIQAAHVGVGISGQEGMQAANSSDYAIAQFRYLSKLLLVHGRWNYVRMGKLILYIFYKNVMMNLTQYWYMIFTGFSGQKFFLEWGLQGYNLFFTALPIVLVSTFEQDVPAYYARNYPLLYRVGQENSHFNTKIVMGWISSCIWESLVICFGTVYGMRYLLDKGETPTMWVYGCVVFTIVVTVVTLKLCLHQQMWWPVHFAVYLISFSLWPVTAAIISYGNSISSAYWNGVFSNTFGTLIFWLLLPLIVFVALCRDFMWKGFSRAFHPSYKQLAQEVSAFGLQHLADKLLAFPPPEKIPYEEDAEAGITTADTIGMGGRGAAAMRGVGKALASAVTMPMRPLIGMRGRQPSISRGSAFSYDAESVMVESFMATDRYSHDPHETRARLFDRHASRGSMAFHGLPDDDVIAAAMRDMGVTRATIAATTTGREASSVPRKRSGRHHSTSSVSNSSSSVSSSSWRNVFRGARHSFGRQRFFSVAAMGSHNSATTPGSAGGRHSSVGTPHPRPPPLETGRSTTSLRSNGSGQHRSFRRGYSEGDQLPTPNDLDTADTAVTPRPTPLVRRFTISKLNRQNSAQERE